MTDLLSSARILFLLRAIVGGIFFYAGVMKLANPSEFADGIITFRLLPPQSANVVALALPPVEIILGLLLATGCKLRPAALGIFALTFIFAVVLAQALIRGLPVDCGCFGSGEPSQWKGWRALVRDMLLMAAAAWVYWCAIRRSTIPSKSLC